MLLKYNIIPVMKQGTATHKTGGHLDKIFHNLIPGTAGLVEEFLLDHKGIQTNIKVDFCRSQNLLIRRLKTQKDILDANLNPKTIKAFE